MILTVVQGLTATLLVLSLLCCWRIVTQWRAHVRSTTTPLVRIYSTYSGRRACGWVCSPWPIHAQRDQGLFPLEGDDAGRIYQGEHWL